MAYMEDARQVFETIKKFVDFNETDVENLRYLGGVLGKHQATITDFFYDVLGSYPATAKMIEGRVERLKGMHAIWFKGLFGGDYGDAYFAMRWKIGMAHEQLTLAPYWVEGIMTIIRTKCLEALEKEIPDVKEMSFRYRSLLKILDMDMVLINISYAEERTERLCGFTGMKRPLLENLFRMPKRK